MDMAPLREALADNRVWSTIGVVRARGGDNSHYKAEDGDVLVDCDIDDGQPVWCRLGAGSGGESIGVWRIPPPGTEVAVMVPRGDIRCDPMIVATLSSGGVPDALDADTLVVTNGKKIKIISTDEDVEVTAGSGKVAKFNGDDYAMPKWDDFLTYFNSTFLVALKADLTAGSSGGCTTTSTSPIVPADYKSTKAKNG